MSSSSLDFTHAEDVEAQRVTAGSGTELQAGAHTLRQSHEFVASSWPRFKRHLAYFARVEYELMKDYRSYVWIVIGFVIIYLHVAAHNLAYYLATPAPPLHDLLYEVIPEMSVDSPLFAMNSYMLIFMFAFIAITGLSLLVVKYPAVLRRTALGYLNRIFMVMNVTQLMRMSTFLVTQVPAPNPNCRAPFFDPPKVLADVFMRSAGSGDKGCGDLIFSSHAMFGLLIVLIHVKYLGLDKHERVEGTQDKGFEAPELDGTFDAKRAQRVVVVISRRQYLLRLAVIWFLVVCFVADLYLILASRKHYSVDVVVSLYITYMVWHIMDSKFSDLEVPSHLADA